MAENSQIKKVLLEVGPEVIIEQATTTEVTEEQEVVVGYEDETEIQTVGTGQFDTFYYFPENCGADDYINYPIGETNRQFYLDDPGFPNDYNVNPNFSQNQAPYFKFLENDMSGTSPYDNSFYHSFTINDVKTIGPAPYEMSVNYNNDGMGGEGYVEWMQTDYSMQFMPQTYYPFVNNYLLTNVNVYTSNSQTSDFLGESLNNVNRPFQWEFKPKIHTTGSFGNGEANSHAVKCIWQFQCLRPDGEPNFFHSPGPMGISSTDWGNNPWWGHGADTWGAVNATDILWGEDQIAGTSDDGWDSWVNFYQDFGYDPTLTIFYDQNGMPSDKYGIAIFNYDVSGFMGTQNSQTTYVHRTNDGEIPQQFRGEDSVQGKTLYLYPTEDSPYQGVIIFDVFEGYNDSLYVRGHSMGILGFINMCISIQNNQSLGGDNFNTINDISVLGTTTVNDPQSWDMLAWYTAYEFVESEMADFWPTGVDISVQGFFSTYKCYLSPYKHGGDWKYTREVNASGSGIGLNNLRYERPGSEIIGYTIYGTPIYSGGGLNVPLNLQETATESHVVGSAIMSPFNDYWLGAVDNSNYIGPSNYQMDTYGQPFSSTPFYWWQGSQPSWVEPEYSFENSVKTPWKTLPTYNKGNVLAFSKACNSIEFGQNPIDAFKNGGYTLNIRIASIENCRVEVLTDVHNQWQKDFISNMSQAVDPNTGNTSGYANVWTGFGLSYPYTMKFITSPGSHTICCPKIYSPFKNGETQGYENPLQNRHCWMDLLTVDAYIRSTGEEFQQTYLNIDYQTALSSLTYEPGTEFHEYQASYWEILKVTPIDPTQPHHVEFAQVEVHASTWDASIVTEEIMEEQEVVVGQTEITEMQDVVVDEYTEIVTGKRIDWEALEVLNSENVPLALTYSVSDVRDVSKRTAGYSKTFELPASMHNERIIGLLSNPGRRREGVEVQWRHARVKCGGVEVFKGFARIEGYDSSEGGRYKCHIIEDPVTWSTLVGDKKLCELNMPHHDKDANNIHLSLHQNIDAFSNFSTSAYYSDINIQGQLTGTQTPYLYPIINYGQWSAESGAILAQSTHPGIWVKYLVDQIFHEIGYKVKSYFMNSRYDNANLDLNGNEIDGFEFPELSSSNSWIGNEGTFRRLFIPYTSGQDYDNSEGTLGADGQNSVVAGRSETIVFDAAYGNTTIGAGDWFGSYPYLIEEQDPGNNWYQPNVPGANTFSLGCSNGIFAANTYLDGYGGSMEYINSYGWGYQAPFTGWYHISYYVEILPLDCGGADWSNEKGHTVVQFHLNGQLIKQVESGGTVFAEPNPQNANSYYENGWTAPVINGYQVQAGDTGSITESGVVSRKVYWKNAGSGQNAYNSTNGNYIPVMISMEIYLQQGDYVMPGIYAKNDNNAVNFYMSGQSQEFHAYPMSSTAVPEADVDLTKVIGCDMKQMDLIKGLTEMFNLHWTADSVKKEVYVEPYNDFYGSGKIHDWTDKVDMSSWSDKYIIDELAKNVTFRYATDSGDSIVNDFEEVNEPLWSLGITNEQLYNKTDTKNLGTEVFASTIQFKKHPDVEANIEYGDLTYPCDGYFSTGPDMPIIWGDMGVEDDYDEFSDPMPLFNYLTNTGRPESTTIEKFDTRILAYFGQRNTPGNQLTWKTNEVGFVTDMNGNPSLSGTVNYMAEQGQDYHSLAWEDTAVTGINGGETFMTPGLYTKYWARHYDRINLKGTLRTCNINLDETDINAFDYRDIILIRFGNMAHYYTVNKIIDYKPGVDQLTKVELLAYDLGKQYTEEDFAYKSSVYMQNEKEPLKEKTYNKKSSKNKARRPISKNKQGGLVASNKTNNKSIGNGIALGHGVEARNIQTVVGRLNSPSPTDSFQIGSGYVKPNGQVVRRNALVIDQDGEVIINGGAICADFTTADGSITVTNDIYYTDRDGKRKKIYIKESSTNNNKSY